MRTIDRAGLRRRSQTALTLACLAAGVSGSALRTPQLPQRAPVAQARPAPAVQPVVEATPVVEPAVAQAPAVPSEVAPVVQASAPAAAPVGDLAAEGYYEWLRAQLRWVPVQVAGRELSTPDAGSRLLLVRSAAERAGLAQVGLDFRDVYGVINAETTWVARTGMGRNGVASHGLAQFEPATARALGVRDANDPVEAVHGAAVLLREAAVWSAARIAGLRLDGAERAARLREGVSIYYNLSSRARARWTGAGSAHLPVETRRHIVNVRSGARQADRLLQHGGAEMKLLVVEATAAARAAPARRPSTRAAGARLAPVAPAKPARPQPLGTITWSGQGEDAAEAAHRAGKHVVWSNGAVTREGNGRVRWSSGAGTGRPG